MADQQPEALRLADWLDHHGEKTTHGAAAAELRRLHEVEKRCDELLNALPLFVNCAAIAKAEGKS